MFVIQEFQESFNPEPINVDRVLEWMEEWKKNNM
ncbi:hypothetical protein ALC53_08406 [Atta colombica]|uniref:Uncharacterized protein n=1 Tax=Atta colombica TaxID=520822 RepID=A0A195BA09_9HYME|nr:hypothetical protein ALC53_08406 [Atta colombica]